MIKAGIINITGYAGAELARILHGHPEVSISSVTGRSAAGQKLGEVFPHLRAIDLTIATEVDTSVDVVFSALPHSASAEVLGPLYKAGTRCVDISADFRLKDRQKYEWWYKVVHPFPEFLAEAVYGLPELHRERIAETRLVANPGCFPTGAILGLAPVVAAGLITTPIIVDAKTGVSGAGRTASTAYSFSELSDSATAYGLSGHRHEPEITQELGALAPDGAIPVTFVPHLVPMTRGILGTCYARLNVGATQDRITNLYRDYYQEEPFVTVTAAVPSTKQTWGSNDCLIFPKLTRGPASWW
jgi:N-acetyl-gamma-glutamyl-phosphate reductase